MKNEHKTDTAKKDAFERCYSRLNIIIGAANSIAGKWLYDAVELLAKDERLYRFDIKHDALMCKRMFDEYERAHLTNHGGMKEFYVSYLDMMDDRVQPHADRMYWAVKNRLDKERVERSALFAKIEIALTLIDYSVYLYRYLIEDVKRESGYDFDKYLRPACLKHVLSRWESLEHKVCKLPKGVKIDLNKDANCMLGFRCIENILTNEDELNNAAVKALQLHPDIAERYGIDPSELSDSPEGKTETTEPSKDSAA